MLLAEIAKAQDAARRIATSVESAGYAGRYAEWYVGITNNLQDRMAEHGLPPSYNYFYVETGNRVVAGEAERLLLAVGFDGGPGGGPDATFVYAFLKWPAFQAQRQMPQQRSVGRSGTARATPADQLTTRNSDLFRHRR